MPVLRLCVHCLAPAHPPSHPATHSALHVHPPPPPPRLQEVRVPFVRPVEDEREARSALTMMAQVAWESQRPYQPQAVVPPSAPQDPANN